MTSLISNALDTCRKSAIIAKALVFHHVLRDLELSLRGDSDLVLAVVQRNGMELAYATPELQDNREVVTAAIKQCGWAFEYASERLRGEISLAMLALQETKQRPSPLDHYPVFPHSISQEILTLLSEERLHTYVRYSPHVGCMILCAGGGADLQREVRMAGVPGNSSVYPSLVSELRQDKSISLALVKSDNLTLGIIPQEHRNDRLFILEAVKKCIFEFVPCRPLSPLSPEICADLEICKVALDTSPDSISWILNGDVLRKAIGDGQITSDRLTPEQQSAVEAATQKMLQRRKPAKRR